MRRVDAIKSAAMGTPRVLVTGGGALLGQGIIRSLRRGRFSPYIIAVDVSAWSAGLYWADEAHLVPFANSPDYLPAFKRLLQRTRPDLVLVGTDVELAPLAAVKDDLEREFSTRILVSPPDVVAIADDKYLTATFFHARGFAAPASALASDGAAVDALVAQVGFPLVVKPCVGARSVGVSVVHTREALAHAVQGPGPLVVQERIGEDAFEYTASGLYLDGACRAAIVMRRDLRDGNTYRAYVDLDPRLRTFVVEWTEALKPYGPANFQFRLVADGTPKVFEINARFSGTTPLRALAGFNEVDLCLGQILYGHPVVQPSIEPITVLRHWSETVVAADRPSTVPRA